MPTVSLRKVRVSDKKYFAKWWRDKELLKWTSGDLRRISDKEVDVYFKGLLNENTRYDYIILVGKKIIGHIPLVKRRNDWYETMIIIGEKNFWGKGYGSAAMKLLLEKAQKIGIRMIYLRARPENLRAIRMYKKSGFVKDRMVRYPKNKFMPKVLRMVWKM